MARDSVLHVWPAYRDGLYSLPQDNPPPAWLTHPLLPTTVVLAEDDQTVPAVNLAPLLGPNIEVVRMASTHGLPLEHPGDVARAILSGRSDRAARTFLGGGRHFANRRPSSAS